MRAQMAPQASMQMRRGMQRGMAPTRNITASPQATVQRPGEGSYSTTPQSRRPVENNMQRRPTPPTYGKSDLRRLWAYDRVKIIHDFGHKALRLNTDNRCSRWNKHHLTTKSCLRDGTERAVFVNKVAIQHDVFTGAISFRSTRASF